MSRILYVKRGSAYQSLNVTMVTAYWLIAERIVDEGLQGNARADYGKALIQTLSESLQSEFGKGFSRRNLEQTSTFYLQYPIPQTLSAEFQANILDSIRETSVFRLSWSHYLNLISIKNIVSSRLSPYFF